MARKTELTLSIAFALALASTGCGAGTQRQAAKESAGPVNAGVTETSLQIPTLDGTSASIDQYKGKVVLVNFWATWCAPCRTEIPWLIEFNQKYAAKGFVILGVAMDDEGTKIVPPWVQTHRFDVNGKEEMMNYPILLGNSKVAEKFGGILGMPTSMLYSRDGKKIKTIVGLIDRDNLLKTLDSQL
jgi:thiol-disulfide isomerase/thioredoxin